MASFKKNIKTSLLFFHFLDSFLCTDEALCDVYLDKCDYYIFIAMLYFHFNTVSKNFIDIFFIIDYVFLNCAVILSTMVPRDGYW